MEKESTEIVDDRSQEENPAESIDKVDKDDHSSGTSLKPGGSMVDKDTNRSQVSSKQDRASSSRPKRSVQEGATKSNVFNGDLNTRISCTACYRQIFVQKPQSVYRHPVLHVLLCKKCYEYYMSGEIRLGEDGVDEQCRWCGDGGKLILCDNCSNTFCKHCIKHNLGRSAVAAVTGQDNWHCYVCDPTPLKDLVTSCSAIMDAVAVFHRKQSEQGVEAPENASTECSSESDQDFEDVFGTSKIKEVVDYLKSFTQPLYQTILKSEKRLSKSAKLGPECDRLKRDLTRKFCKFRKAFAKKTSKTVQSDHQNGSVRSAKKRTINRTRKESSNTGSMKSKRGSNGPPSADTDSSSESVRDDESCEARPSRADMEAQRQLHCQLLGDGEDDQDDVDDQDAVANKSDSDEDSSSSSGDEELSDKSSSSSDDEYNPAKERKELKAERKSERTEHATKTKTKAAMRKVKEIRERIEKNKLKHKKEERKRKAQKAKKSSNSNSEDEKDNAGDTVDVVESSKKSVESSKQSVRKQPDESLKIGSTAKELNIVESVEADVESEGLLTASSSPVKNSEDLVSKDDENEADKNSEITHNSEEQPVQVEKVGMKTRGKATSSQDPTIDKVIATLEKMPKITIKLSRLGVNNKAKNSSVQGESKSDAFSESKPSEEAEKTNKGKSKISRQALIDSLTSDEDDDKRDEVAENDDDEVEEHEPESHVGITDLVELEGIDTENGDEEARKALLAEAEDNGDEEADEDDNDAESDDDDIVPAGKKTSKKPAKKSVKQFSKDSSSDSSEDSEMIVKKKKPPKSSKLLRAKLSDSEDDVGKNTKRRSAKSQDEDDSDEPVKKKARKRKAPASGDDEESVTSSDDEDDDDEDDDEKDTKKSKRKRIQIHSDSSVANISGEEIEDDGGSSDDDDTTAKGRRRKKIRRILKEKALSKKTVDAAKAEQERRERITERQKLFNQVTVEDASSPTKSLKTTKLVLEADEETVEVHKDLICKLKPHQVEAVKFMWNCCVESLERLKKEPGSGCILAHCMGLGKTLSVISFVHTVLSNTKLTKLKTCLVLCPLNTILNWQAEFEQWLEDVGPLDVYEMSSVKDNWGRSELLNDWKTGGGVMIMGYEMFRNLSQSARVKNKKQKRIFAESLLDPGPDLVVCDEGHVLKNDATGLSKATTQVKTRRRIVLTGTPLQNNLVEYHCMVNFVKPNLLGSRKEFCNRFVNPIMNGQCSDSSARDVKLMKHRAHILHDLLAGCVQRKDYSALTKFLPPKHEYVLSIRLCKTQIVLYEKYLERLQAACGGDLTGQAVRGSRIFTDYQNLMKIWTHPWVLKMDEVRQEIKRMNTCDSEDDDSEDDSFIDDYSSDSKDSVKACDKEAGDEVLVLDSDDDWKPRRLTRGLAAKKKKEDIVSRVKASKEKKVDSHQNSDKEEIVKDWKTRSRGGEIAGDATETKNAEELPEKVSSEWWAEYLKSEDKYNLELSGKLQLLAEILKMAESIGDKVLVFSQSLLSLDLIEQFLAHWDSLLEANSQTQIAGAQTWLRGLDYFRMDGSSSAINRRELSITFNDPENVRARLFLISTRAGSLGINLVAANRVVVFDASWNPTHDVQSIFRVYRFGQQKPVYVYRFLAQGTMEEKIYERQVAKQSLAQRVIDEHQIERHFSANDLRELYVFKPDRLDDPNTPERPTPALPKDRMLAELLVTYKDLLVQYHEHDSLLENKLGEELTEEERKAAWEEFENEKKGLLLRQQQPANNLLYGQSMVPGMQMMHPSMLQADYSMTINSAHHIAKAIFASNPGISQAELTSKVTDYLRQVEIAKQQEVNAYRRMVENTRLLRMQEDRRRQEMLVNTYRSRIAGTATDQALDQDLISILSDSSNHSRVASTSSSSGVGLVNAWKDRDGAIIVETAPQAGPSSLDPVSLMRSGHEPSSS